VLYLNYYSNKHVVFGGYICHTTADIYRLRFHHRRFTG